MRYWVYRYDVLILSAMMIGNGKRTEASVGRSGMPASPGRERLGAVVLSS